MAAPYDYGQDYYTDPSQIPQQGTMPATGTTTPPPSTGFDSSKVPSNVPIEWAQDFISRNPGDYHRLDSAYESDRQAKAQPQSSVSQWTNQAGPPEWYNDWFTTFRNQAGTAGAETKSRSDSIYQELLDQINQAKKPVDRNDPIIRAQADAFSANTERQRRTYLANLAESEGSTGNIQGEARYASERAGQASGAFEAQLMQQELTARRAQLAQELSGAMGFVSADKAAALQREMAILDQALKSQGLNQSWQTALMGNDLGNRQLGLQDWDRQMYWDLLQRGLIS